MQISLKLLKKFIPIKSDPKAIGGALDMLGIEVEHIEEIRPSFKGVIVAEVQKTEPHPDAERLVLAEIFDGEKNYRVVCGAPNCRSGIKVAYAPLGACVINRKTFEPMEIKEAQIRGEDSQGMLLAEEELGLSDTPSGGIWELNPNEKLGDPLEPYFTDTIFHVSLTPNLAHCQSLYGIARELAASFQLPLAPLPEPLQNTEPARDIDLVGGCRRYTLSEMTIEPQPTPLNLRGDLHSAGMRSISLPVDLTNYIMTTYGLPTHVFDASKLSTSLRVAPVTKSVAFTTLDGKERMLEKGDIGIWDGDQPIAIAGIMGGQNSEVSTTSTRVALEAAAFDGSCLRKTSRRLALRTESSARYERGSDPEMPLRCAAVFVDGLKKAGSLQGDVTQSDANPNPYKGHTIKIRSKRVEEILGFELSLSEIQSLLESLGLACTAFDKHLMVSIPSFRGDLHGEIDLIEEVARLYGYHNIPQVSSMASMSASPDDLRWQMQRELRGSMKALGAQEMMTCNLISEEMLLPWEDSIDLSRAVRIKNASIVQYSWLRPSLLPGLCQALCHNADRSQKDLFAFEVGFVHMMEDDRPIEPLMLTCIMSGSAAPAHFSKKSRPVNFLDLKGKIETLLEGLHLPPVLFSDSSHLSLHPHVQAALMIGECTIGQIGRCHPLVEKKLGIPPVFLIEINVDDLLAHQRPKADYKPLSIYPSTERDWTLCTQKEMPYSALEKACLNESGALLKNVELIGIYEGDQIKPGHHNVTVRLTYQKDDMTIAHGEAEEAHLALQKSVESQIASYLA